LKKALWKSALNKSGWPFLPCPKCEGDLKILEGTLKSRVPRYADKHYFDPTVPERFVTMLVCAKPGCGEAVALAGEVHHEQSYDEEGNIEWLPTYQPSFMRPAPPVISVPKRTPAEVVRELKLSFELYWADYSVCAARMRTSLERLMDHFGVAKTRIQKDQNPAKPGKRRQLDLSARIDKMAKKILMRCLGIKVRALKISSSD
jgi:Domain of unknown function (DUF4145)